MHFYPQNTVNSFFLFEYLYFQREKEWFKLLDQHKEIVTPGENLYSRSSNNILLVLSL